MYDIITIGSASIDVFIKSKQEIFKVKKHLDFGYPIGDKILINKLNFSTGGGGTNTAVAFSRLGLKTGFIGVLGNDSNSQIILKELKKEKISFLGRIKKGLTGYSIILAGNTDRTILTSKGVNNNLEIKDIKQKKARWIYMSTMLEKSLKTSLKIIEKTKNQGSKIAVNLSLYLARKGVRKLSNLLKNADILIINKEEARALTKKKEYKDIFKILSVHTKGIIVITDGFNTIHSYYNNKTIVKKIKKIKPVDTTGAGDAFASGFVYGIIKGKSIPQSLNYGHKEALSVLRHIGAKDNLLKRL